MSQPVPYVPLMQPRAPLGALKPASPMRSAVAVRPASPVVARAPSPKASSPKASSPKKGKASSSFKARAPMGAPIILPGTTKTVARTPKRTKTTTRKSKSPGRAKSPGRPKSPKSAKSPGRPKGTKKASSVKKAGSPKGVKKAGSPKGVKKAGRKGPGRPKSATRAKSPKRAKSATRAKSPTKGKKVGTGRGRRVPEGFRWTPAMATTAMRNHTFIQVGGEKKSRPTIKGAQAVWAKEMRKKNKTLYNVQYRISGTPKNVTRALRLGDVPADEIERIVVDSIRFDNYLGDKAQEYQAELASIPAKVARSPRAPGASPRKRGRPATPKKPKAPKAVWDQAILEALRAEKKFLRVGGGKRPSKMGLKGAEKMWKSKDDNKNQIIFLTDYRLSGLPQDVVNFMVEHGIAEADIRVAIDRALSAATNYEDPVNAEMYRAEF